jgi:IMP cyclohydrolase
MTDAARIAALINEEKGFLGYVSQRLALSLAETQRLVDADPVLVATLEHAQATATPEDADDRSAAACRRLAATGDGELTRLARIRLRERRQEETDAFLQRVLPPA